MAENIHKLAALRLLGQELGALEAQRRQRLENEDDAPAANREAAQMALNAVLTFFQDYGIETGPLIPLLAELVAVSAGSRPSAMLKPATKAHRAADPPTVEAIKGRLAAVMEYRQRQYLTRKAAAEWVVRHTPSRIKKKLGLNKARGLDNWLAKWGGQY